MTEPRAPATRPELRLRVVENKAETLSIAIRRRGEIFLKLSRASNNRCRFCNDAAFQDGTFWPFEALQRMIDEGLAQGVRKVFLSGGEPTLHPRFLEVIAYARRQGAERVIVITNGRLFSYPEFTRKAVRLGLSEAFVAVLGSDAATHDDLTQVEGSFEQTSAGVRALLAGGVRVHLSTVVNRRNVHQLGEILGLFPGVTGLTAVRISPAGRALFESIGELGLRLEDARPHLRAAFATADRLGIEFRPKLFPISVYEGRERDYTHQEEYLPEIKDTELRAGWFSEHAVHGRGVPCRGETCDFCYREPFCDALYRARARLEAPALEALSVDLDDPRQRSLLPAFAARSRAILARASTSEVASAALAAAGVEAPLAMLRLDATGEGALPATQVVLLPWGGGPAPTREWLGAARLFLVAERGVAADPARCALAEGVVILTHERFRDQERGGVTPTEAQAPGLPVVGLPPCLGGVPAAWPAGEQIFELGAVASPEALDVVGVTHAFLRQGHRAYADQCAPCRHRPSCPGLHVNQARAWGLGVVRPAE